MTDPITTAQARLREMIDGYRISRMIGVAAELCIADLLAAGPKHSDELARASATNPQALYRLLRTLTSVGVFVQTADGRFDLNPLAELLRTGAAGSLCPWAIFSGRLYRTWADLGYSIETGETAFDHLYGMSDWQYQEQNPEEARVFNDAHAR